MLDLESFEENGYLIVKDFFKKPDVEAILEDAKSTFHRQFLRLGLVSGPLENLSTEQFDSALYQFFEQASCRQASKYNISFRYINYH